MKVLVTGGAGFLGKAIVRKLLEAGHSVRSFSRGSYPELEALGVEVHSGCLSEARSVLHAAQGCDAIIHTAAKAGICGTYEDYHSANVVGTRHVIQACLREGIKKLVYTSSPSVVFHGGDIEGWNESAPYPARFEAHYPKTKARAEQMILVANGPRLSTVALRPHLILGPGDPHLIPRVIEKARTGKLRTIKSNPPKLVDWIHVDNAAQAHLLALDRLNPEAPISGRAYFLSQGEPIEMQELINRILASVGLPPARRQVSARMAYFAGTLLEFGHRALRLKGEPAMTRFLAKQLSTSHWFDISAAKRDLGYEPFQPRGLA